MNELLLFSSHLWANFIIFLIILLRVSSIVVFAPVLSSASIPPQLKIAISLIFSLVLFSSVKGYIHINSLNALYITEIVIRELALAVLLALTVHFIWSGVELGAQLVGFNMGFAIANVLSPQENVQISVLSEFESIFAILVFLAIDGHYAFIKAMAFSFKVLPVGSFTVNSTIFAIFNRLVSMLFTVAFSVLAPAIMALFITQVVFGLIARTMPQINIMIVAFPLSIAIGFLVLGASFIFMADALVKYYNEAFHYLFAILKAG